ncbi:hypothetical protein P8452_25920 [Trifolium repens]|nr:hypothetical protein P8452_25920 [Trifolium repens]
MILSFSLFLVAKRVDCGILSDKPVPCDTIYDCPQIWTRKYYCINNECVASYETTVKMLELQVEILFSSLVCVKMSLTLDTLIVLRGCQLCAGCMFFGGLLLEIHRLNRWLKPLEFVGMVYVANNIEMIEITKLSIVEDLLSGVL